MITEDDVLDPQPSREEDNAKSSFFVGALHVTVYYAVGSIIAAGCYSAFGHYEPFSEGK